LVSMLSGRRGSRRARPPPALPSPAAGVRRRRSLARCTCSGACAAPSTLSPLLHQAYPPSLPSPLLHLQRRVRRTPRLVGRSEPGPERPHLRRRRDCGRPSPLHQSRRPPRRRACGRKARPRSPPVSPRARPADRSSSSRLRRASSSASLLLHDRPKSRPRRGFVAPPSIPSAAR
jgi:hypothetical protein